MDAPGTKDLAEDLRHPWVNMWSPLALIVLVLLGAAYTSH